MIGLGLGMFNAAISGTFNSWDGIYLVTDDGEYLVTPDDDYIVIGGR